MVDYVLPQTFLLQTFAHWPTDLARHVVDGCSGRWPRVTNLPLSPLSGCLGEDEAQRLLRSLSVVRSSGRAGHPVLHFVLGAPGPLVGSDQLVAKPLASFTPFVNNWFREVVVLETPFALGAWHRDQAIPHLHLIVLAIVDGKLDRTAFDDLIFQRAVRSLPGEVVRRLPLDGVVKFRAALAASYHHYVTARFGFAPSSLQSLQTQNSDVSARALPRLARRLRFAALQQRLRPLRDAPEKRTLRLLGEVMRSLSICSSQPEQVFDPSSPLYGLDADSLADFRNLLQDVSASAGRAAALVREFEEKGYADAVWATLVPPSGDTDDCANPADASVPEARPTAVQNRSE